MQTIKPLSYRRKKVGKSSEKFGKTMEISGIPSAYFWVTIATIKGNNCYH